MKTLPQLTFNEQNNSAIPPITLLGQHGLIVETLFGATDKPYFVQTTDDFLNQFGSYGAASPHFASIMRALKRGASFWIQRLTKTAASAASLALATDSLVTVTAKWLGAWANGTLGLQYTALADGAGTNKLVITYGPNPNLNEVWTGTSLATLIANVNAGSKLVTITTAVGFIEPITTVGGPVYLAGGADGAFANDAARDTAVLALLPRFDDAVLMPISTLSAAGSHTVAHYGNLNTYVSARQDIMGIMEIDPTISDAAAVTLAASLSAVYSQWMALYYSGQLTAYDATQAAYITGGCHLDVLAVWSVSDTMTGNVYKAPAGSRRGLIPNIQSFASNMLSPARITRANALVAAGVNVVGADPAFGPVVWGAQTFYQSNTAFDAINVRRTITSLRAQLSPIYRSELFEPMDPITWRDAYGKAIVILKAIASAEGIYTQWTYVGDQEASTIADAKYNDPVDLANGIYKVKISVVPVGYIGAIDVELDNNSLLSLFNSNQTVQ